MKHGKKALVIAVICLTALIAIGCVFSPYIDSYRVNRRLDISGVKLLMSPSEVEKILGKGSPVGGFGAHFYEYDNAAVMIAYPVDGMLRDKAGQIAISDHKYSICGVRQGDSTDQAKQILEKLGFVQDQTVRSSFRRGSARIDIYGGTVRVDIEDWTLRGRVY